MPGTEPKDIAYIVEHLNGKGADSFESYTYEPEVIVEKDETKIKSYDVIRLTRFKSSYSEEAETLTK